jgi:hypothetical protein
MFQKDFRLEALMTRVAERPMLRKTLSLAVQKQLDDYAELKRLFELPANERPLRRSLMSNEEKAGFIARKGHERYLALPY